MSDSSDRIHENLARVRDQIASAAQRSGRSADEVTLVCVTKYVDDAAARALVEAGCCDLGESRPQELWRKAAALEDLPVRWHLIGHLQRNKAARTLPLVTLVHSVDSMRLLTTIDELAARESQSVDVLLEVNLSGEPAKHGFDLAQMPASVDAFASFQHLRIRGLMGMAGLESDRDQARREFAALRALRDELQVRCSDIDWRELSMGMSDDFDLAIEEGATIVRVGSTLFEGLE